MKQMISPMMAIFFIINVMIGSGIFLNTGALEILAPHVSFLAYLSVGILMLPIVIICFKLLSCYPRASFYQLGNTINPLFGLVMSWGYFFGKLATMTIALSVGSNLLLNQNNTIFTSVFSISILIIFLHFTKKNVSLNNNAPLFFCFAKIIPLLILIGTGLYYAQIHTTIEYISGAKISDIISCIPLTVFAFAGFESLFAIASRVKKNAFLITLVAFMAVLILYFLYQYSAGILLDRNILKNNNIISILSSMFEKSFIGGLNATLFTRWAIGLSALGASYGVFVATIYNVENLYEYYPFLQQKSQWCAFFTSLIYILLLKGVYGNTSLLQQLSSLGTFLTYTYCIFIYSTIKNNSKILLVWTLLCWLIIGFGMVKAIFIQGMYGYMWYMLLVSGSVFLTRYKKIVS